MIAVIRKLMIRFLLEAESPVSFLSYLINNNVYTITKGDKSPNNIANIFIVVAKISITIIHYSLMVVHFLPNIHLVSYYLYIQFRF